MSGFLHRLGAWSFRHKWQVVAGWLVVLVVVGGLMVKFQQPPSDNISIPGTQAQDTLDKVKSTFPDAAGGSGRIVFEAPKDKTIDDYKTGITETLEKVKKAKDVDTVVSPFEFEQAISKDRKVAFAQVQLSVSALDVTDKTADDVAKALTPARDAGVSANLGGDIIRAAPGEILGIGEIFGVLLALIVLVITFRSLIAAGIPLVVAIVSVGLGAAGLYALSEVVEITSTAPVLAIMLGLAVGIDYSLFILSRYRKYLKEGDTFERAVSKAIGTAGNAVIFAAATVVIALASLSVVQIPFMTTMGLAAAATVAVAAVVSVTLTPALLGIIQGRIFGAKDRKAVEQSQKQGHKDEVINHKTFWYYWGSFLQKNAVIMIVLVVVGLVVVALPATKLQLGLPTDQHAAKDTTERKAYDALERGFGAGFNAPLLVFVEGMPKVEKKDVDAARQTILASQPQVDLSLISPEQLATMQQKLEQGSQQMAQFAYLQDVSKKLDSIDGVKKVQPAGVKDSGTKGILQVIPNSGPSDQATIHLIEYIRDNAHKITGDKKVSLSVTGSTALQTDIDKKLGDVLPIYLAVVVGLSFLILVLAFRSFLVPIKATLGFLLSVAAMFGALVMAFQWGWLGISDPTPIVSFLPIISIGILFGLAMDYEFFLVSSIHESYTHTKDSKRAVVEGFSQGSQVVTAAAIIMTSIFAGFIFNHDDIIRQIGFALAFGVFVDAFLVRMMLVPAIMSLLGKSAWWLPDWVNKLLPNISIEGKE